MNTPVIPLHRPHSPTQPTDEELLEACAEGDSTALTALFDRHHRNTWRFLQRTYNLETSDLEDVLQLTFLDVYHQASRFQGRSSVASWIFGIALNKARHHARSATRRSRLRDAVHRYLSIFSPPTPRPADVTLEHHEKLAHLDRALARLPENLRIVFVMVDIEEIPGIEAARILEIPEGTLYRRLHEARKTLRETIQKEGP